MKRNIILIIAINANIAQAYFTFTFHNVSSSYDIQVQALYTHGNGTKTVTIKPGKSAKLEVETISIKAVPANLPYVPYQSTLTINDNRKIQNMYDSIQKHSKALRINVKGMPGATIPIISIENAQ